MELKMRTLKISLLVFILSISVLAQVESFDFSSNTNSDTVYLPLQLGNTWQYFKTRYDSDGPSYSLSYSAVDYDTIIGDNKYFKFTGNSTLIRYSQQEKKMYIHWNDSDYVHIDFNMPNGTQYQSFSGGQYRTVYAEAGDDFIFGLNRLYGGYLYIPGNWGYNVWYTDSIGMSYDRSADSYLDTRREVIQVILYDSLGTEKYFTDHHKPNFQLIPITLIDSEYFNLDFKITHYYTKVLGPHAPPWHSGLDFIDSVRMYSYYAKDDSIVLNPTIIPNHLTNPVNVNYSISIQIDTLLMKNGFVFNYRFRAKDKGIIPEFSYSPDTGYYQCIWDTAISAIESGNGSLKDFSLSQNYPNPFNPTTSLQYAIGSQQFVTIKVYDLLGREVATLVNEEKPAGKYEVEFNGSEQSSGIYFYQLKAGEYSQSKKMILLK
jgi:hypothetical protein